MFRRYGFLGLLMILFAQVNFILVIQPFAQWYFPIIWFGYILLIDSVVYKLRGKSLISNRTGLFVMLLILSSLVWWMFEVIGYVLQNWYYTGIEGFGSRFWVLVFGTVSFATVIPAVFETAELLKLLHLFDKIKLERRHNISKELLYSLVFLGIAVLAATLLFPRFLYPLIWVAFFLILDPVNYLHKQPSIISHLKDRRLAIPISLFVAGTICGFLWEFWNFYAVPKWHYSLPFVDFFRIFEMPVLGYLGYGPFAFELYAMYNFLLSLARHRESDYIFKLIS